MNFIGPDVVFDCDELVIGNRVRIMGNAQFVGRRIVIGDDFFCSDMGLRVGRGRRTFPDAVFQTGKRCTLHDNVIDLDKSVTLGDDVGLSPGVTIYTHGYWLSWLEGWPCRHEPVVIADRVIIGFRTVIAPGAAIGPDTVVGAQAMVSGKIGGGIFGGVPAKRLGDIHRPSDEERQTRLAQILAEYGRHCLHRGFTAALRVEWPLIYLRGCTFGIDGTFHGQEDEYTDDFRDFAFRYGLRYYSDRPFRRL